MQALAERTILASSIDWPPTGSPVWPAVEAGARFGRDWGLSRGGFAVRLADVVVGMDCTELTWWFVGLVVGGDWSDLQRWRFSKIGIPLLIGGRDPLRRVYGRLGTWAWSGPVEVLNETVVELASARGAIAIALAAGS